MRLFNRKIYWFPIVLLLACPFCNAQRAVGVSGEYTYNVPENVALNTAKAIAIERAKLDAMAKAFETVVSQTTTSTVTNENGKSQESFHSYGGTETKGLWLGDTREPVVNVIYANNLMTVTAKVWGKAREIKKSDIELMIKTLCNDAESGYFKDGDRFAVKFKSPVNGYLAIFLIDDNVETAYCLLPYDNGDGKARSIEKNKEYEFLSTKDAMFPYRENTVLTTSRDIEHNRLAFIFSTNEFAMPLTDKGEYVTELPFDRFEAWLQKNRIRDEDMQVIDGTVEIRKQK